jgi:peroxiredoxin
MERDTARVAAALASATVLREDGRPAQLAETWQERPAVLVFLRHFACLFCREQLSRLNARNAEIEAAGARLVAIGNGTPNFIAGFRARVKFAGPVYTDPSTMVYRSLDFVRGGNLSPRAGLHLLRAMSRGYLWGCPQGDARQQGGVIIMLPGGSCSYAFASRRPGDHPREDAILAALRRAPS